jgi:hypothetical protein
VIIDKLRGIFDEIAPQRPESYRAAEPQRPPELSYRKERPGRVDTSVQVLEQ